MHPVSSTLLGDCFELSPCLIRKQRAWQSQNHSDNRGAGSSNRSRCKRLTGDVDAEVRVRKHFAPLIAVYWLESSCLARVPWFIAVNRLKYLPIAPCSLRGANMTSQSHDDDVCLKHELAKVRRQIKAVQKSTRSRAPRATSHLYVRRIATIVYLLSTSAELAAIWASRAARKRCRTRDNLDGRISAHTVLGWVDNWREDSEIMAALQSLEHNLREQADDFLIETLLIEDLLVYWSRGIQTTTEVAIMTLLRKWRLRPSSARRAAWLQRLADDTEYRKSWGRHFRARWNLRWAGEGSARYMTSTVIQSKAAILIRWLRWSSRGTGADRPVLFINMDETSISCLKTSKKAMVGPSAFDRTRAGHGCKKQRGLPRCALIASIVNDDALQSKLPQVFLPRSKPGVYPPRSIRNVIADAQPPVQAYHGGSGFQSADSMRQWLKDLRRVLLRERPDHIWVLVMDCYSVHVSMEALKYAKALRFVIVLIPGRMTWLLQPLDSHIFAGLKQVLRRLVMHLRISSENGTITWSEGLKAATTAVRQQLVSKSWRHVMQASGMDADASALRPALANVLRGVDLNPRPPTKEEMEIVLGTRGRHAGGVWELLVGRADGHAVSGARTHGVNQAAASADEGLTSGRSAPSAVPLATGSSAASGTHAPHSAPTARRVPVGRRLWTPQSRNLMLQRTVPLREGPSAGTRSQGRPCRPGVVQTESQSRESNRGPPLSSVL